MNGAYAAIQVTRSEFLDERKSGLGGSDIASLFGIGYGCRRRLWYDKSGIEPDYPQEETALMELGQILEPYFADKYQERTGRQVTRDSRVIRHFNHPELLVHLDGMLSYDPAGRGAGVLEIKSVGRAVYFKVKREGLPEDYVLQLQHGMLVTESQWGSFAVGSRDSGDLMHWDAERDEQICSLILKEGPAFWQTIWNESAIPPRLSPDDRRCQKCAWRQTCQGEALLQIAQAAGDKAEIDESLRPLRSEYIERKALAEEAEGLLEETKEELKSKLGDRVVVRVGGSNIYYRPQTAMLWESKLLAERYDALRNWVKSTASFPSDKDFPPAETFKKPSVSRPLRVY